MPSPTHVTSVLNKYLLDTDQRVLLENVFMKAFLMIRLTQISFYSGFPVLMAVHSFIHSFAHSLQHSESIQRVLALGQALGTETK